MKPVCAVIDCPSPGRAYVCPFDNRQHHHGMIHYSCGYPPSTLKFRDDGWHLICEAHYQHVKAEREKWEANRPNVRIGETEAKNG
jgi:hypothetical protein